MVQEIPTLIRVREADLVKLICEANSLFLQHDIVQIGRIFNDTLS